MNREEHLQWCKNRALQYVDQNDTTNAFSSFQSDIGNHEGTANHMALELGTMLLLGGHLSGQSQMRDWIAGFN